MNKRSNESPLDVLLRCEPTLEKGIVLQETGFPYGGVTTYAWWKSDGLGFFKMSHRKFGEADSLVRDNSIHSVGEQVEVLLRMIEDEYDDLENYFRNVRDGVVYVLSWGTKERQRVITMQTPTEESRHYQLVKKLKESLMKPNGSNPILFGTPLAQSDEFA
jgi:hypothetical protein